MSNPTLTWVASTLRAVTVAGTNSTVAELLTAIKAAIDTDSTLWETSAYSAGSYIEIKRRVSTSPTGDQATVRILLFGGATPNVAACTPSVSLAATNLYSCMSVDANTTGPTTAFTAGAPYSTKFVPGNIVCVQTALQSAETPRVSLIESVEGLGLWLGDTNSMTTVFFGNLVEEAVTNGLMWGMFPMGSTAVNQTSTTGVTGTGLTSVIPSNYSAASSPRGTMWNSSLASARSVGRAIDLTTGATTGPILGTNGAAATLLTIPLLESSTSTGSAQAFLGYLRQVRLGPQAQHIQTLRNGAGVTQAIHFGPPSGLTGYGAWFDQVA